MSFLHVLQSVAILTGIIHISITITWMFLHPKYCVKNVQIESSGPYSVRMRENKNQKLLRIWTTLTQWNLRATVQLYLSLIKNFPQFPFQMSYVSNWANLTATSVSKTWCHRLLSVLLFKHWKFFFSVAA